MMTIKKEIEVVTNMIRLLHECLAIAIKNRRRKEANNCRKDLEILRKELTKLLEKEHAAANGEKEPTEDAAAL